VLLFLEGKEHVSYTDTEKPHQNFLYWYYRFVVSMRLFFFGYSYCVGRYLTKGQNENFDNGREHRKGTNQLNQPEQQAAIYIRSYPRSDEVSERNSTEQRIQTCLRFAQEQGYRVDEAHIYQDISYGTTQEKKGIESLREALPLKAFAVLIVPDVTHISWIPEAVTGFLAEAKNPGVSVVSIAAPPFGYQWNKEHTLLNVYPQEAQIIQHLFEEWQQ